jgi:beta-glucosidase
MKMGEATPLKIFNDGFVWGVATASYQIEGATEADGRGRGNWDVFSENSGAIYEGHKANVACDHYHRLEEDLDLISALKVSAYRFSVSWSRVLPEGIGRINEAGLRFYDRLIDGLLERGITPYLTLYHWDLPAALEEKGGFRNPEFPGWFAEFTRVLAARFGDRVRNWFTLNEPHAFIEGGLRHGRHAPGLTLPLSEVLLAGHHALLGHGLATQVLRAEVKDSWIAMAPVLICASPKTDSPRDLEAARRYTFSMTARELRVSSWWMDPAFSRGYPEDGLRLFGRDMCRFSQADLDTIAQPLDAVGFNLYDCVEVEANEAGDPVVCPFPTGGPRTAFNWPVTPKGHFYGPLFASERYKKPIFIAENGLSCRDFVHRDGAVHDLDRIDFIESHLVELARARMAGVDVGGYFHWSLLDNFEWNHGFRERFGLVHIDYKTLERTKKDSFYAYRDLILGH